MSSSPTSLGTEHVTASTSSRGEFKRRAVMLPDRSSTGSAELSNIVIPCRGVVRLSNVRGMTLHVVHGSAWITQSESCADVSRKAGESFCVDRGGRTLVAACHDAPFTELRLERSHAVTPTLGERLRRTLFPPSATPVGCPAPASQPLLAADRKR